MEVNVIAPEERAKVEDKSYLRNRLAGFNARLKTLAKHAHWTEFQARFSLIFIDLTVLRRRLGSAKRMDLLRPDLTRSGRLLSRKATAQRLR
jgi:hypothetical protein